MGNAAGRDRAHALRVQVMPHDATERTRWSRWSLSGSVTGRVISMATAHQEMKYPMWVISVANLLKMTAVEPHQVLRSRGVLVEYSEALGPAIFVSHQHRSPSRQNFPLWSEHARALLGPTIMRSASLLGTLFSNKKKRGSNTNGLRVFFSSAFFFLVDLVQGWASNLPPRF